MSIIITRRTLLLYNFAIAGLLLFLGLLSMIGAEASTPRRLNDLPTFSADSRLLVSDETDIEKLKQRATFYFDIARDLKRARTDDGVKVFRDASTLAFIVAGLFALGGVLLILYARARKKAGLAE